MSKLGRATGTQRARKRNDFYPTIDRRAIAALAPHVPAGTIYGEPCAGRGDLVQLLAEVGLSCEWGLELEPDANRWPIGRGDALQLTEADMGAATVMITNPPWTRDLLHAIIGHLAQLRPVWMLFDAAWPNNQGAARFGPICTDIVAVGRLKWFEGSKHDATDDCAWYRFDAKNPAPTRFHFRTGPERDRAQLSLL